MNTVALRKVSGKCKQFPKLSTASWNVSDGNVSDGNVSEGNVPVFEDIKKRQSMSLSRRHSDLKLRLHRGQRGNLRQANMSGMPRQTTMTARKKTLTKVSASSQGLCLRPANPIAFPCGIIFN